MCRNGGRGGVGGFLRVGQEVLSISAAGRKSPGDEETLWWIDTVQQVGLIKAKERERKM